MNEEILKYRALSYTRAEMEMSVIPPSALVFGDPSTWSKLLGKTKDKLCYFMVWECGATYFEWYYDKDEFFAVISGEAFLIEANGCERRFEVGDIAFFPAGTKAIWRVPDHVRKIAMLKPSAPYPIAFFARAWNKLTNRESAL